MSNEIKVGSKVNVNIIKGGYWHDSAKGTVTKITDKSYIVESPSHHFWSRAKRTKTARAFSKAAGNVTLRAN